jgi:CubicO group peptidase (beta-lactamase class C family)
MMHTSGLPAGGPRGSSEPQTLTELVTQGAKSELLFEPGTQWNYSNIGIDILGRIVEVVSHQPFEQFLRSRIFESLEMHDTFFFVPADQQSRLATLYTYDHGKLTSAEAEWGSREPAGMFRYNSLGTYVKGGAYRTYEWVDPEKDLAGVFMMQLTNGGGDVADPINSFMAISAAAIER